MPKLSYLIWTDALGEWRVDFQEYVYRCDWVLTDPVGTVRGSGQTNSTTPKKGAYRAARRAFLKVVR